MAEKSIDEIITERVNDAVEKKVEEIRTAIENEHKLQFPCSIQQFKAHFHRKDGSPMPDNTFSSWRKRGLVKVSGRMVLGYTGMKNSK